MGSVVRWTPPNKEAKQTFDFYFAEDISDLYQLTIIRMPDERWAIPDGKHMRSVDTTCVRMVLTPQYDTESSRFTANYYTEGRLLTAKIQRVDQFRVNYRGHPARAGLNINLMEEKPLFVNYSPVLTLAHGNLEVEDITVHALKLMLQWQESLVGLGNGGVLKVNGLPNPKRVPQIVLPEKERRWTL